MSIISRQDVANRVLQGQVIVIYDHNVLRIPPSWLDKHPGGGLAIRHFIGRDATDEILAYHVDETLKLIQRYSIGKIEKGFTSFRPPIDSGFVYRDKSWVNERFPARKGSVPTMEDLIPRHTTLSLETEAHRSDVYKAIAKRVTDAGLYQCRYLGGYGPEILRCTLLGSISVYFYKSGWFLLSALFLGLFWQQSLFFVHDLGHMGVTHNWAADRILAVLVGNCVHGLSVSWWVDNHNIHHIVTNSPEHDPDIEHLPFFAISTRFFHGLYSSYYKRNMAFDPFARFFVSLQHYLFYVVLAFARFNLFFLSYTHLFRTGFQKRARGGYWAWSAEIVGLVIYWSWYTRVLKGIGSFWTAFAFMVISHVVTSPLHVQLVLSHFSRSTEEMGPTESFLSRQLRTTTDVVCPESIEFIHGGLHLQVTHHLFPRLPRHNLRRASLIVKEFTKKEGLEYAEFGFVSGNMEVISVLRGVAQQVSIMAKVTNAEVHEAVEKSVPRLEIR